MKNFKRLFIVILLCVTLAIPIVGCSPYKEVEKASKGLNQYTISATLDENMELYATEQVQIKNQSGADLNRLCFNLYGRAFREGAKVKPYTSLNEGKCFFDKVNYGDMVITSAKVDGADAEFQYVGEDENAVEIPLNFILEQGDSVLVELGFNLKLANCTHRLGYFQNSINLGNWYPILAEYEKGEFNITPYYSTGDPFYSKVANYEVSLTYPSEYGIWSSGKVEGEEISGSQKTTKLSSLAMRDFAINLGKNMTSSHKNVKNTKISCVGYEGDELNEVLDVSAKAVSYFSKAFGEYPYEKLDVVKAPFLHGGMEYPGMVIISDSISEGIDYLRVVVHEIAHQWWYAVVGNNEIDEAWLDESLAEYSSALFFENHPEYGLTYEKLVSEAFAGYVLYADIVSTISGKVNTSMLLPVYKYNGEYEYSYMIYVRGVLMFDSVRQITGKDKLIKGFKKYYAKYKFGVAHTDDFISTFEKTTHKYVDSVFDSWLNGEAVVGTI